MSHPHNTEPNLRHLVLDNKSVRATTGTSIEIGEFSKCPTLETVKILASSNITSLGYRAFYDCISLQSIHLSENIRSIGRVAFYGCRSLQSIHLPESVTSIGDSVFYECTSLQSISIPENVTFIRDRVFFGCRALRSISIPENVRYIGEYAFCSCKALQSIHLPENITSIGPGVFSYCTALQSINIPESVTSIGNYAFSNCESLQSIHLSENITLIENHAFYKCTSLRSISIPESVTSIGYCAFNDCDTLNQRSPHGSNSHNDTVTWLRQRFNDLPIHQACYHFSNDMHQNLNHHLSTLINENRQSLAATDAMGMTALHILCCNPHATIEMVQLIVENDPSVLSFQDVTESTPLKLFLEFQGLLGADEDNNGDDSDSDTDTEQELLMLSLRDLLRKGIKSKELNVALILSRDLEAEATLANPDGNTKLKPFMSAATFSESDLDMVYTLAMKNLNAVVER